MGSEAIHFEALRKQLVMDRRNALNIRKKHHVPPFQSHYTTYELPKDDMYVQREATLEAKPTVHEFTCLKCQTPWKFVSSNDIHGNSSASFRIDNSTYSSKQGKRFNNVDYISQW
ncbi:hypothetical protein BpHYR1_018779 [Brachionus plicatilis]|uniref:Uncharacterized protein n=1 Tax=Brachionus plicatilis TaxID=10195 RepID=A0A3M7SJP4_BRAPC|nr:hypothetical protein BpHYR1_018779 [Brachionus plicatilis]